MACGGPAETGSCGATSSQQVPQHTQRRQRKRCLGEASGDCAPAEDDVAARREAKRLRASMDDNVLGRSHPQGVKPLGNMYIDDTPSCRESGLGAFAALSDEVLVLVLESLDPRLLSLLGATSKAMYAFSRHDELWKTHTIRDFGAAGFAFKGTWRATYASSAVAGRSVLPTGDVVASGAPNANVHAYSANPPIVVSGLYSDELFRPWHCATLEFDPLWGATDNIDRRSNLSLEDFIREYEQPNRPVILTDVVTKWPAFERWDRDYLLSLCGDVRFEAGPVHLRLADYWDYMSTTREESPVYLFDPRFAEKVPQLGAEYAVPDYFAEDLFALLGPSRPDYRWLIIGGAKSGSVFHIDPNSTSAWNAVVRGSKKWIMYPPECVPPGVIPSCDGAEVTSPVSLAEWFLSFYAQTREGPRPIECVCRAGELLFVPRGWWHLVVNLEESVAITQNYVSSQNLLHVLDFLQNKPEQVSGVPREMRDRMGALLEERHRAAHPGRLDELRERDAAREERRKQRPVSLWDSLTVSQGGSAVGTPAPGDGPAPMSFSFGFA